MSAEITGQEGARCITCGAALHPERALKYNYCTARACQEKNATGLTMVAIGMNKAADELMILDERTAEELASGRYRDQRRGSFGVSGASPAPASPVPGNPAPAAPGRATAPAAPAVPSQRAVQPAARRPGQAHPAPAPRPRRPWTDRQERLARLYNQQGLRPDEIARKLGVSTYLATQIILAARSRAQR
jgi:hypothetical protein